MGGETYELDGLDFLNPASTAAVLFQTFMGAACVFTHEGGAYQIQLVNQRFIEELGGFFTAEEACREDVRGRLTDAEACAIDRLIEKAERSGEMAEGDFKRLSRSASAYLDSITFDRIPSVTDEKIKERVKEACCAVADVLLQKEQRDGIASETNDGISVTYTTEGSTDEQRLYRAAVLYLSNTGLLYRGVE